MDRHELRGTLFGGEFITIFGYGSFCTGTDGFVWDGVCVSALFSTVPIPSAPF